MESALLWLLLCCACGGLLAAARKRFVVSSFVSALVFGCFIVAVLGILEIAGDRACIGLVPCESVNLFR